ncbi:hypothetical protein GF412_00635 [Candidatus Micrarchaeota archaeon]|nr:hypothetical protein [Candidatus Micrarchaeota archaeon]MBD3417480.1 hypothetical protein [Candidatus Micrarchaeota archaeon]
MAFLIGSAALIMDALGEAEAEEAPGAEAIVPALSPKSDKKKLPLVNPC